MVVPHILRSSAVAPSLLADRADYALRLADKESKETRVARLHRAFVELVRECADATKEPDVVAVLDYLDSLGESSPKGTPEDMAAGDLVAFTVEERYPMDLQKVRAFWANKIAARRGSDISQCLVCGQERPIAERHTVKIKGIPGGQPSGTTLVSANAEAFESYGMEASLVAPVCLQCAETYATALNTLIRSDSTGLRMGNQVYIFWTRQPAKQGIFRILSDADPEDVKRLLSSVTKGTPRTIEETNRYYATALSASGGRVVVRDWIEGSLDEAQRHLVHYFQMQQLPKVDSERQHFSLRSLMDSIVPQKKTGGAANIPHNAVNVLVRTALTGVPLPQWMLFEAVSRNRAEQGITRSRAALMKLIIMSCYREINEEGTMANEDQNNSAYLCGRLLRILEHAQQVAVKPKATLIDRYYGSASSAPGSVFGLLFRNAQAHLGKLRTEKPGLYIALQKDLSEVMAGLDSWPRTLNLREQALFALGYYHQRTKDFTPKAQAGEQDEVEKT
jgi:CRISPR-associated protein Csd1